MFEKATRLKVRFNSPQGVISVEDLWDLPLTKLNKVAQSINHELKNTEESFITELSESDTIMELRMEIVKHVISVRLAENASALDAKANNEKREKIMGLIERKKDDEMSNLSVEELEALL